MKRFINWLTRKISPRKASSSTHLSRTGAHLRHNGAHSGRRRVQPEQAVPKRQPEYVDIDAHVHGRIEEAGPGKNVLIRNKFIREDTGTHETLMILDDSVIDTKEEEGIDPYNSGQFDRSRNWDKRSK
jgi:hypothetical protein